MTENTPLLKTPLAAYHALNNAKMVNYAGWEMPLTYGSILEEHSQVRNSAGLFDVSHMGRLKISGRDCRKLLEECCTRRIHDMTDGQIRYSLICNENGGIKDDVLVYRLDEFAFLIVCNASNREKIRKHLLDNSEKYTCKIKDETMSTAMVAIQGPKVFPLITKFSKSLATLKKYRFIQKNIFNTKILISRTGYTGEDGVEIIFPSSYTNTLLKLLLNEENLTSDIKPAGLGARDSLRIEAAMPLYGQELSENIDPIAAGLRFAVALDKDDQTNGLKFIGQEALQEISNSTPASALVGLEIKDKKSPRTGMNILENEKIIGSITSGLHSPTLNKSIGMAYLPLKQNQLIEIDFGTKIAPAIITPLPFYKKN